MEPKASPAVLKRRKTSRSLPWMGPVGANLASSSRTCICCARLEAVTPAS